MEQYLKEPTWAALFAMAVTVAYAYAKARLNNEPTPENSECLKPAVLVGMLVYFIVSTGVSAKETISLEPFDS